MFNLIVIIYQRLIVELLFNLHSRRPIKSWITRAFRISFKLYSFWNCEFLEENKKTAISEWWILIINNYTISVKLIIRFKLTYFNLWQKIKDKISRNDSEIKSGSSSKCDIWRFSWISFILKLKSNINQCFH